MNDSILFLLTAVSCLVIGIFLGYFFVSGKKNSEVSKLNERLKLKEELLNRSELSLSELKKSSEHLQQKKEFLQNELTSRNVAFENLQERIEEKSAELENLQERFTKDFEIVANKILDEKSYKFTLQNKENLDIILKPLHERIQNFEKKVEDTNKESLGRHGELRQQIKGLAELNLQMSKDADNLTKALKGDAKLQGNWGELILTRVLEKSGLELGREYTLQDSHTTTEGNRLQTDVLIHLPDGKKMIVDSKVSLVAFERFVSEEDQNLKATYLKQHIHSIKRHIDSLSTKNYHLLLEESPDTVFMFIPIEPAFAIASANEPQLYEDAFTKNVIIVTPSTLLAALKLVENLWQNDKQKRNAIEIATQAGRLYDAFTLLTDELIKIGNQLGTVNSTYERTMTKLTGRGNLITRVENLKTLGAKATKQLDQTLIKRSKEEIDYEKGV